jgi:ABC-2 type transport system ATP-binding protein
MIRVENVSKTIKGKCVLDNINFTFQDEKTYRLKGINGSGKTMLMRMIAGLIYPTQGKVIIDGKVLGKDISFPPSMGILIESPSFLDSYTGYDNLKMLASLNEHISDEKIRESLRRVGLEDNDKRKYRKYSLGMKQRLGIAAAIMESPQIIILDEPLNALDNRGVDLFSKIMIEEKKRGALIILAYHEGDQLDKYVDEEVVMESGKIADCKKL